MTLYGEFTDVNEVKWYLEIYNSEGNDENDVYLGETPVIIATSSAGLFDPIKSRSMTIEVFSQQWFPELYEPASRGTKVKLYTGDVQNQNIFFRGYLTPCRYDQSFTYIDTIQLEAIDAISSCKDFKWQNTNQYEKLFDIIISILKSADYRGKLYIPQSYTKINTEDITGDVLDKLYASSNNFIDDDEERTPWTEYNVLYEIMNFLGWSMTPYGDDIWCIDYRAENQGVTTYSVYDIQTGVEEQSIDSQSVMNISLYDMAPGESKVSIDDVYNKIEVSDNLYKVDEIAPDIFDDKYHISINEEKNFPVNEKIWTKVDRANWFAKVFAGKQDREYETGFDYQTICRLDSKSGWTHRFYKRKPVNGVLPEINTYYDESSNTIFNGISKKSHPGQTLYNINKYVNTTCCLLQHHAYREVTGNRLPTSLDWDNLLTFFVLDDTCCNDISTVNQVYTWEVPVLEYETDEEVMFKPATGTTWITIKGDLYYQNNKVATEDKSVYSIINYEEGVYATAPVDNGVEVKSDQQLFGIHRVIDKNGIAEPGYGTGWECWKMKLQIGDKYWNGGAWVDTEATFYIPYNNGPGYDKKSQEYIPNFDWASPVSNNNFKDKVGVDGYGIPISFDDDFAPTKGKLKLSIYVPALIPPDMRDILAATYNLYAELNNDWLLRNTVLAALGGGDVDFGCESVPWVIFCKDFELGVVYTDTSVWWDAHESSNKDKVYIGYINDTYKEELDNIEMKLNTATQDTPISKSYITVEDTYLATMKHAAGDEEKIQEYNIVDMYLDHNSERKVIYERNMKDYFLPNKKFTKTGENGFEGTLMIDTQGFDVKNNCNTIKFIEF